MPFRRYKLFIVINNPDNNISNDVLCDAVNTLHQGILYFQKLLRFSHKCVYVISLTPIIKEPAPSFTKLKDAQSYYMHTSYTEFHPDLIMMREIWKYINSRPYAKYGLHYTSFQKTQNLYTTLHVNRLYRISHTSRSMGSTPYRKDCLPADFHKTHTSLTTVCKKKNLLYKCS
jgi:hypothetical protein